MSWIVLLVTLTAATIRGVALGVVGVALIQSLLLGLGFFAIGLNAAGPLTLVALLLGIMQVPLILLSLPVVGYVVATEATQAAIIFLMWNVVVGLSEQQQKILLGIDSEPTNVDTIVERSNVPVHLVLQDLTFLTLKGVVRRVDGQTFARRN